jgi:prolipoprotein diacylglyceryl transferase
MILASIPSPTISSFQIGPLTIRFYAIAILVGVVLAVWILNTRWKKLGGTFDQVLDVTLITVVCGLVGARIYHVLTTWPQYFPPTGDPANIVKVWEGGMAIFGGLIGGFIAAWLWTRHKKYSVLLLADALAPGLLVAQAVGRLGNWFNQELYGGPTTLPWGLQLNDADAIGKNEICYDGLMNGGVCPTGTLVQPTFLYEIVWNLIGAAIIVFLVGRIAKSLKGGQIFAIYLMWYALGRSWIEALRVNYSTYILGIRINVWAAFIVFILGAIMFVLLAQHGHSRAYLAAQVAKLTKETAQKEQKADTSKKSASASTAEAPAAAADGLTDESTQRE